MIELSGKKVVVVGLGRTGVAVARFCVARGAIVTATDAAPLEQLSGDVRQLDVELRVGGHANVSFQQADLIIVSPGVPPFGALDEAAAAGVEVIGEIELASRFGRAPIVAVGGTNGKSTTTVALAQMLEASGLVTFCGGNLGTPLIEAVERDWDVWVAEVSSFQLERAPTFRPKVGLLLNVSEDHLDRYSSFEAYVAAKGNAFVNQQSEDFAVIAAGDARCRAQAERGRAQIVTFGAGGDYVPVADAIIEASSGVRFSLDTGRFQGAHNCLNAAAAVAAARVLGVSSVAVERGLNAFLPLGHRMALVAEIAGVRYYDDSKATNVGAAVTALSGLSEPYAVLIAGGRDKQGSYAPLADVLTARGRAAVLIGEAAERIAQALGEWLPVERAASMDEAVRLAAQRAHPGDAVLLSPACSSFDWFSGYAERGERFVAAVARLQAGEEA